MRHYALLQPNAVTVRALLCRLSVS